MANHRKYFIVNTNDPNILEIFDYVLEKSGSSRTNADNTKTVVKLREHQAVPNVLTGSTSYTHDEIKTQLQADEWTGSLDI